MTEIAAHPELAANGSFAHLKLGRLPRRDDPKTLRLAKYLDVAALPPVPETVDVPAVKSWGMYGNDRLGDCTLAAAAHLIMAWSHQQGHQKTPAVSTVERAYWEGGDPPAATGEPGGPTDTGRVELDVLNSWRHTGIGRDKISADGAVDPRNPAHLQAATYLFGGVYLGVALPLVVQRLPAWMYVGPPVGPGRPGSWGGHAVPIVGYDQASAYVVTWGATLRMSWRFCRVYVDEAYAILSPDWLGATGKTVAGFDSAALQADLAALAAS